MIKITKVRKDEICSCNSCGAPNYETKHLPNEERAKAMYEVSVGKDNSNMVVNICKKCMYELEKAVEDITWGN